MFAKCINLANLYAGAVMSEGQSTYDDAQVQSKNKNDECEKK